jgi:uncharacterized membrane protein YhhN
MSTVSRMGFLLAVLVVLALLALVGAIAIKGALWLLVIAAVILLVAWLWPGRSYRRSRL